MTVIRRWTRLCGFAVAGRTVIRSARMPGGPPVCGGTRAKKMSDGPSDSRGLRRRVDRAEHVRQRDQALVVPEEVTGDLRRARLACGQRVERPGHVTLVPGCAGVVGGCEPEVG